MIDLVKSDANTLVFEDHLGFDVTFEKDEDTEAYTSTATYIDDDLIGYTKTTIINMILHVEEYIPSSFKISEIENREGSNFTQFVRFSMNLDSSSIGRDTILLKEGQSFYHSDEPVYKSDTPDRVKVEFGKARVVGETITLDGIKSSEGDVLPTQTWEYKGDGIWERGDIEPPVISSIAKVSNDYNHYIYIKDDYSGIDSDSVNAETVVLTSDVNTYYSAPEYEPEYNDIAVSIERITDDGEPDAFAIGDKLTIDGVKDLAGNVVEIQTWIFGDNGWSLVESEDEVEETDTTAPSISSVILGTERYQAYINLIEEGSGIDTSTISSTNILFEGKDMDGDSPTWDADNSRIVAETTGTDFEDGDRIQIGGIQDNDGNTMTTQTFQLQISDDTWNEVSTSTQTMQLQINPALFVQSDVDQEQLLEKVMAFSSL